MTRSRVCVLTSSFPETAYDAGGVFVRSQVVRLARDLDIDVVYPASIARTESSGEPFFRRPVKYPFRTRPMSRVRGLDSLHAVRLVASFAWFARTGGPYDLYHAYWAIPAGFVGALVKGKQPLVVWLGGSDINLFGERAGFREAVRWSLRRANHVIAVSMDLLEKAVALGLDPAKASVIPSGVDTGLFHPENRTAARRELGLPDGFLFVVVGSLLSGKRVDRLIRIVVGLARECDCHLVVVGDGPERPGLERLAGESQQCVLFLGHLSNERVSNVVAACDAFVMASESEGLPTSAQEAMACGTPVVAIDVGGLRDIVGSWTTGLLARDESDLERLMAEIASSSHLAIQMGVAARQFACRELDVERSAQRTLEVYRRLLDG